MEEDGVWRTVSGRRIFIKNGQSLTDAMKSSGKFKDKSKEEKTSDKSEKKQIRKPENITDKELEELKKLADIRDEEGFKQGVEKAVFDKYGMNDKHPEQISQKEFDKLEGKTIYRGIGANSEENANKYRDDFLKGDIYSGHNNTGSGTWFTENQKIADSYKEGAGGTTIRGGSNSFVVEAKIDSNAKIIKASDLPPKSERLKMYNIENDKALQKIIYDDGLYATMLGYDILETQVGFVTKTSNYSVLNRSILKVRK